MKLLLYCTKSKPYLYHRIEQSLDTMNEVDCGYDLMYWKKEATEEKELLSSFSLNGKIVAECDFEVEEIEPNNWNAETEHRILKESCLKEHQLFNYIINGDENEKQKPFYAIHIKNLHIFDRPRELFNYSGKTKQNVFYHIENAPQNMMYAYGINTGDKYILISIRPEWMCKILNKEKTIEVRKKVLKEML